jgi:peptidoglycan/xylan/chitin deacetylase (PgdA/CDA1 family)
MSTPADRIIPILLYHSLTTVASPGYRPYSVPPDRFRSQMEHLAEARVHTLTVGELVDILDEPAAELPDRCVLLTFDDGFDEIHGLALPILDRLGLRATAFVVTGYVGGTSRWLDAAGEGTRRLMSWTQLAELAAHGVEVGSHSHGHRQLDTLSTAAARDEIVRSKSLLEDRLGLPARSLAYPHGYHSATIKRLVRQAGYSGAVGVKHALSHPADDRWALGRAVVGPDTTDETLDAWLAGVGLARSWTKERPVTRAWRLVRRARAAVRPAAPAPDLPPDPGVPTPR